MNFSAKAIMLIRNNEGKWVESEVIIQSADDIREVFSPFKEDVTQVDLNVHEKVYYSICNLKDSINAHARDFENTMHFMVSPLLLVSCDDEKPIDMTEESKKSILEKVDLL